VQRFVTSRDDAIYEAFPDVALTQSGALVCVFLECTHHSDRSHTRIVNCRSSDRGRSWSAKSALTPAIDRNSPTDPSWNCPRITALRDGRLVVLVDQVGGRNDDASSGVQSVYMLFSEDEGLTWSAPHKTPAFGIVPDRLIELSAGQWAGRWLIGAHTVLRTSVGPVWHQRCWLSDDWGASWQGPVVVAAEETLKLCEGSVFELPSGELVCMMRENSGRGLDAFKTVSADGGRTWGPVAQFPLPGCHRPVGGVLANGSVLITHRFMQGGQGWVGWWTQNLFAGLTDVASCLAAERSGAHTRILPIDFDRNRESDTGYSGWVQFTDGEIYVVNYLLDDAPKAQIRGYSVALSDFYVD